MYTVHNNKGKLTWALKIKITEIELKKIESFIYSTQYFKFSSQNMGKGFEKVDEFCLY